VKAAVAPLAIEVRDLVKRFGDFTAVDGISFEVRHGEIFGFLGPNGAGKSTTIRVLTTLLTPTAGVARINGYDLRTQEREVRHSIGVIPQAMTSDLELTAWENMEIHAKFFRLPKGERKQRIVQLLERVDLYDRRDSLVRTFSGGMRRRLEIARGLVHRPAVLFLDEPTTGLDPASRHVIRGQVRRDRHAGAAEGVRAGLGGDPRRVLRRRWRHRGRAARAAGRSGGADRARGLPAQRG
jgi:ABC-2 type transport system ATP-binding protein